MNFAIKFAIILLIFGCENLMIIEGIKGNKVLSELEDTRNSAFVYTTFLGLALTSNSSSEQIRNETVCNSDGIQTINPLASSTSQRNFSLPLNLDDRIDLLPTNEVSYFRSSPLLNDVFVIFSNLKTINGQPDKPCDHVSSLDACGVSDLSSIDYSANNYTNKKDAKGTCLAVKCNKSALIRVSYFESYNYNTSNEASIDLYTGPILFKKLLGVEEDKYYTMKSFGDCKKKISKIFGIYLGEVDYVRDENLRKSICNLPSNLKYPYLSTYYSLMAADCNLKEITSISL